MSDVLMTIKGLMLDPITNSPIVLLKDDDSSRFLPIWVGVFEANAIALQLESVETPRPMTHDLLRNLLDDLEVIVARIVIDDLQDNTFYAKIHVDSEDGTKMIDSRPSDAIALALRTNAPIFVSSNVLDQAQTISAPEESSEEMMKKFLENMSDEDLGKYEM